MKLVLTGVTYSIFTIFTVMGHAQANAWTTGTAGASVPKGVDHIDFIQRGQNKAIARRVFEEIFNQGKFRVADEIYVKDFLNHGLHKDSDLGADRAAIRWEKKVVPDLKISEDLVMAEGDSVTVVWTARGTNTGRAGAWPATGVKLEI